MNELPTNDKSSAKPREEVAAGGNDKTALPASSEPSAPGQLTKEEQWALFEKELKESDWGHQPC